METSLDDMVDLKVLPNWADCQDMYDWEKIWVPWCKNKPVHRKILYNKTKDQFNYYQARTAKLFVKDEKIDKPYSVPRLIVPVHQDSQNHLGPLVDIAAKHWRKFNDQQRDGTEYHEECALFTMGLTGEQLAEDMLKRPTSFNGDFVKFDKSIHWLLKSVKIRFYLKHVFSKCPEFIRRLICLSIVCIIRTEVFNATLYGKTFSGDWDTLSIVTGKQIGRAHV